MWVADPELLAQFEGVDPAEVFRTSGATLQGGEGPSEAFRLPEAAGVAVDPAKALGHKCARCWRILPEVKADGALCLRCEPVVEAQDRNAGPQ